MLPGVEVARKRRLHHHHHHHTHGPSSPLAPVQPTSMGDAAIAARRRLEDKLRRPQLSRLGTAAEKSMEPDIGRRDRSLSAMAVAAGKKMVGWRSPRASSGEMCLQKVHLQKYHLDCLTPWMGADAKCPCCRTLVPSLHAIS